MRAQRHLTILASLAMTAISTAGTPQAFGQGLNDLSEGKSLHGFRTTALYLDDEDKPMGARFIHERTGFVLDLLQIQSVPQGFIWVNSFPTSDMGEPHTQEHLLLGKGNMGRYVSSLEGMSLAESNAFTQQWRTCYHFNTGAGPEIYYDQFKNRMDALLHPDYTDEEIRREVCNFGVSQNPGDGKLRLEEKGTVYNEMVSSFERSWSRMSRPLDIAMYGKDHPLAFVSGGLPSAIREMGPEHIRKFHRDHYRLDNMGMVGSFPKEMALADLLRRHDAILSGLQKTKPAPATIMTEAKLPKPAMAPAGTILISEYPNNNEGQTGPLLFAWPAWLKLSPNEHLLLEFFVTNLASDETSNLYKRFIDTKTRTMDVGAQGVFGWVSTDQGEPIYIGIDELPPANMTEAKIAEIRAKIIEELAVIASWKDGSPEVAEFNARIRNRITASRRDLSKFVNSPPGFGFRNTGSGWMSHLQTLEKTGGFRKSVTMKPEMAYVESLLAGNKNIWRDMIRKWRLTETQPYAAAARPSPDLIKREAQERQDRIAAELARLKKKYGVSDDQEAIRRYQAEYDAASQELERVAAGMQPMKFIDAPPLTLDDQLDYKVSTLPGNVQMVASTFDNMTSGTVGLALSLKGVPEQDYIYLSILPGLLTGVGVVENGTPVPYDVMSQRLREEILGLNAYYSLNSRTSRAELVLRGAGNNITETERSIAWMKQVLQAPDWRPENLPRIRDLVDQTLAGLRSTMQGREEAWVHNPSSAYRWQDNLLMLSAESFLTRTHNVHRLRWLLKDAGSPEERDAIASFLSKLGAAAEGIERKELDALLNVMKGEADAKGLPAGLAAYAAEFGRLGAGPRAIALEAAKDLDLMLGDIPDGSLAIDWKYLCNQMRHDLLVPPAQVLADLNALRNRIASTGGARMFMIGSRSTQEKVAPAINSLLASLNDGQIHTVSPSGTRLVETRMKERIPDARPVYVGLVNPSTSSGVFLNSAPITSYRETDRESVLRFLAAKLYAGQGAHAIFMKTWAAGLAYSNGIGSGPAAGRISYYAERCPELPQTLRFVIDELKKAKMDEGLAEYAIGLAFEEFRSASSYESRGESMAADLADGITPEVVSTFRRAILDLRKSPTLAKDLFERMPSVYERILPGYGVKGSDVEGAIYYVIGPEKQLALYDTYLKTADGPDTKLYRIYPRDYWMKADIPVEEASGHR